MEQQQHTGRFNSKLAVAEEPIKGACKLNPVGWKPPNDLVDGVNFLGI